MRWTVRGVDEELARLASHQATQEGTNIGSVVNQALEAWLDPDVLSVDRRELGGITDDLCALLTAVREYLLEVRQGHSAAGKPGR